jgi:hypothetical protein
MTGMGWNFYNISKQEIETAMHSFVMVLLEFA